MANPPPNERRHVVTDTHTSTESTPEPTTYTATFRPHPKGFGFATVLSDTAEPERIFVPPALTRRLVADDVVRVDAIKDDKGLQAVNLTVIRRQRRMISGTVAHRAGRDVLLPDPTQASSWIRLDALVAATLKHAEGRIVVVLLGDDVAQLNARALVAGPFVDGSPATVRARTVVATFGRISPDTFPGAAGSTPAQALTTHLKLTGQLAGGSRGDAAGKDRNGPVPGITDAFQERRDETCITIDGEHSRDLDDAVFATWDGATDSTVNVAVHIVDAARAIGIDSPADQYAKIAAATTYFTVGENAPMIDPGLSEDTLSLLPNVDRFVVSVRFEVTPDGTVTNPTVETAAICSRAKLSYGDLDRYLHGDTGGLARHDQVDLSELTAVCDGLIEAARRLGTNRDAHTSLSSLFTDITEEPAVEDGRLTVVAASTFPHANRVVERLMVAANETVAGWLHSRNVPSLYRTHLGLDVNRAERVFHAFKQFGIDLTQPSDIAAAGQTLIAELIAAADIQTDDDATKDLLVQVLAQATARAQYSPIASSHVGLNAAQYTHFTSPLRRYADLAVHRQVRATLAGEPAPYDVEQLHALGAWLDAKLGVTAQLASAERAALWDLLLARGVVAPDATATITAVTRPGIRLRFPTRGTSGFIPAQTLALPDGARQLDVDDLELQTNDGQWQVGQTLDVTFDGIDATGRANWRPATTSHDS